MTWEQLARTDTMAVRRRGRFLVADLLVPHHVISTSPRNGGQVDRVRHLLNHQSCEATAHHDRHREITEHGQEAYHDVVCAEIDLPPHETVVMSTAANMNYAAVVTERDACASVTAIVTAGVHSNATCAGDPAHWRETSDGMSKVPVAAGTINTMLVIDRPLTIFALTRAIVTMTEAKSAALQRLAVPSRQSSDLATGTGTDQFCLASPIGDGASALTSTSPHVKLGEIIGLAVRNATMEALRWQNGLEPSYTRGLFHALGRYGVREQTIADDLASLAAEEPDLLSASDLELLQKNREAVFYEPLAGAAAHAMAAVLDRV
jgi:adenosylcobinamide amidohydrolase